MPYTDDPGNSLADRVRFLVADTIPASPLLTDNEVAFLLEDEGNNPTRAAARAAEVLAAKYTKEADDKQVGPLRLGSSGAKSRAEKYSALAKQLWARAGRKAATSVYAGGISAADKETRADDSDRVHPSFARDMMDYPVSSTSEATKEDRLL